MIFQDFEEDRCEIVALYREVVSILSGVPTFWFFYLKCIRKKPKQNMGKVRYSYLIDRFDVSLSDGQIMFDNWEL